MGKKETTSVAFLIVAILVIAIGLVLFYPLLDNVQPLGGTEPLQPTQTGQPTQPTTIEPNQPDQTVPTSPEIQPTSPIVQDSIIEEIIDEEPILKPASDEVVIRILRTNFDPEELNVDVGTTVTWINEGTQAHQLHHIAVNRKFTSDRILPGDTFSYTFDEPGTYRYGDTIRTYLDGYITVGDGNEITGNVIGGFAKTNILPLFILATIIFILSLCYVVTKH